MGTEEFKDKWVVIEWFDDQAKGNSVSEIHVFDSRDEAREFKKYRATFPDLTSIHLGQSGS